MGHSATKPPVIGVAGAIGSGKSTVAAILASLGCHVLDADEQAKAQLDIPEVRDRLVQWWGGSVLTPEGRADRAAIASIVFADDRQRRRLESLIHPEVIRRLKDAIANADPAATPAIVLDVPLLFETGMDGLCDAIVFVDAPEATRLARVQTDRGWDAAELSRRQASQRPLETKRAESDFVVMNAGVRADLEDQVRAVFGRIHSNPGS